MNVTLFMYSIIFICTFFPAFIIWICKYLFVTRVNRKFELERKTGTAKCIYSNYDGSTVTFELSDMSGISLGEVECTNFPERIDVGASILVNYIEYPVLKYCIRPLNCKKSSNNNRLLNLTIFICIVVGIFMTATTMFINSFF